MQDNVPPQVKIWQLGLGFTFTNALVVLVKAGIPELIKDHPKSVEEIAAACRLDSPTLFRFLRFAANIGVIEEANALYSLTEVGKFLLKDHPATMAPGLALLGMTPWQNSWANLFQTVESGKPAFDSVYGEPFFEYMKKHPEYGQPYDLWMTRVSETQVRTIVQSYDFSKFKTISDVGGGHGLLLHAILSANPNPKGILFDQESVVKNHRLGSQTERVQIMSGDFFVSVPHADLIVMKTVIHDWDDENSRRILANCRAALKPGGKILVAETVIGAKANFVSYFYDLHMLLLLGGRERTEAEFRRLFADAGLKITRIIETNSPMSLIEAEPA